ncbi:TetR/AcrR family transcriptional regulator [Agromyces archimandritae]|uniref:TetR family transcriptional regulator n=1 Tax=Agromyces archimandritae TaxID=2781962 RepID=A0A975IN23_9MICO|nr:TetR/AcrR family transcriptional regulator [Agromyces archimandritae]QTX04148.1 TetR family transcriptional regulator [Agromyces archimandritae]
MPAPRAAASGRRARLTPEERRAQLVALGVAALAEHPLGEISLEALAADAGVSRGLVFHYFGSKQGLSRELVRTARDSMLRATEPRPELEPLPRLHDTLERTVGFVRDHGGTFFSLVRGTASGDPEIRAVVEQARVLQTDRVTALFVDRGIEVSESLRFGLRAWIAFVEQMLVDAVHGAGRPAPEIVALLEGTLAGIVREIEPEAAAALFG